MYKDKIFPKKILKLCFLWSRNGAGTVTYVPKVGSATPAISVCCHVSAELKMTAFPVCCQVSADLKSRVADPLSFHPDKDPAF
jgi:hypothetical protein